jgi:hypothetical protein
MARSRFLKTDYRSSWAESESSRRSWLGYRGHRVRSRTKSSSCSNYSTAKKTRSPSSKIQIKIVHFGTYAIGSRPSVTSNSLVSNYRAHGSTYLKPRELFLLNASQPIFTLCTCFDPSSLTTDNSTASWHGIEPRNCAHMEH